MIYEPNTTQWQKGDLVIHDCDRKCTGMLMRVTGYKRNGEVKTRYITPPNKNWRKELHNPLHLLLDPARFNIDTSGINLT